MACRGYLGDVVFCRGLPSDTLTDRKDHELTKVAPSRIAAPCVVVLAIDAFECRSLVYRD